MHLGWNPIPSYVYVLRTACEIFLPVCLNFLNQSVIVIRFNSFSQLSAAPNVCSNLESKLNYQHNWWTISIRLLFSQFVSTGIGIFRTPTLPASFFVLDVCHTLFLQMDVELFGAVYYETVVVYLSPWFSKCHWWWDTTVNISSPMVSCIQIFYIYYLCWNYLLNIYLVHDDHLL